MTLVYRRTDEDHQEFQDWAAIARVVTAAVVVEPAVHAVL
jgi:hypothetical protein